jgi:hypothetical protein
MTLAMLIVTFLILFVELCLARSLSGKHQRRTDIDASAGDDNFYFLQSFIFRFFALLLFSTRYDVSGVGQGTQVG